MCVCRLRLLAPQLLGLNLDPEVKFTVSLTLTCFPLFPGRPVGPLFPDIPGSPFGPCSPWKRGKTAALTEGLILNRFKF